MVISVTGREESEVNVVYNLFHLGDVSGRFLCVLKPTFFLTGIVDCVFSEELALKYFGWRLGIFSPNLFHLCAAVLHLCPSLVEIECLPYLTSAQE